MREDVQLLGERAAALLAANPSLTLHEIAHLIGSDRHKIQRAIREQCGFNFRKLKRQIRLKRALMLLEEQSSHCVKEIADEIGFTASSLSRFMRRMTGCCPLDMRRPK